MKLIETHNERYSNGLETFDMGMNQFTDLTENEFQQTYCTAIVRPRLLGAPVFYGQEGYPTEFDWRQKGGVAQIKN